jgi:hypothetical protein
MYKAFFELSSLLALVVAAARCVACLSPLLALVVAAARCVACLSHLLCPTRCERLHTGRVRVLHGVARWQITTGGTHKHLTAETTRKRTDERWQPLSASRGGRRVGVHACARVWVRGCPLISTNHGGRHDGHHHHDVCSCCGACCAAYLLLAS